MSSENGAESGTHYHYHFYGAAPQGPGQGPAYAQFYGQGQPQAYGQPQQAGGAPGIPGGFPGAPYGAFRAAPGYGAGPADPAQPGGFPGFNLHRHPGADSLVKGLVVGAAAAYLLTNEKAQKTIMRTVVQAWAVLQGGIEELKERLHDAEAEVAATTSETSGAEPPAAPPAPAQPGN